MNVSTFLNLLIFAIGCMSGYVAGKCSDDNFQPCSCNENVSGMFVSCNAPIAMVKKVFSKLKTKNISQLSLTIGSTNSTIVANVTGNVKISVLSLVCLNSGLVVDPSAFNQTKLATNTLYIRSCDLSKLNWGFLTGFTVLKTLDIRSGNNFPTTFGTFPSASLTSLSSMNLDELQDMNKFTNASIKYPTPLKNGLTRLYIGNIIYPSMTVDAIIQNFLTNWITPSSRNTLREFFLMNNNMGRVPTDVAKYNNLANFNLFLNYQPWTIQSNAFNVTKNTTINQRVLDLSYAEIESIQAGAFQGFYGNWFVDLSVNRLTQFSSSVFQTMLQQMTVTNGKGYLKADENPFECGSNLCGLAWLVRDNRSYLNRMTAQCSNGTNFNRLNPATLRFPNRTKCP